MELMMSPDTVEQRQFSADVVFLTSSHCHDPGPQLSPGQEFDPSSFEVPKPAAVQWYKRRKQQVRVHLNGLSVLPLAQGAVPELTRRSDVPEHLGKLKAKFPSTINSVPPKCSDSPFSESKSWLDLGHKSGGNTRASAAHSASSSSSSSGIFSGSHVKTSEALSVKEPDLVLTISQGHMASRRPRARFALDSSSMSSVLMSAGNSSALSRPWSSVTTYYHLFLSCLELLVGQFPKDKHLPDHYPAFGDLLVVPFPKGKRLPEGYPVFGELLVVPFPKDKHLPDHYPAFGELLVVPFPKDKHLPDHCPAFGELLTLPMQLSKMEFSLQVVDGPRDR
ncbi:hypothetical protein INR49_018298 [Caranx melampygus]|nr:hypothetical protein INR49_018298 [Caranx melampygus]